ncbi:MAG: sigma-54-dependent Fis family transcriptional regulator [Gemmatimonadetes bacterium]|nr:sigma-54-dependent Fis family transcriptional regulator [Gemmatimonadota bacterium]
MKRIVLVEDRKTTREMVEETLRRRGWTVASGGTVDEGKRLLDDERPDFLLTDLQLPDGSGLSLLEHGLLRDPELPVLVMSAFGTIEIAVEAVKSGAYDFVTKPFDTNRLVGMIDQAVERRSRAPETEPEPDEEAGASGIVGRSPAIRATLADARKVARSDATVLITGESGTGKELVARAIHGWSGRAEGPLLAVNCAAIPRELMEAEFFGAERGAFTGATARKLGRVELASGGTLFLDEIGELPPELQAKLLRVLQERTFMRVGGTKELQADLRIVAATNQDLESAVAEGGFREDLFYRLNVFPIHVPALRDRDDDVELLARRLASQAAERDGLPVPVLTGEVIAEIACRSWPGNVRELQNAMERAVILAAGGPIGVKHIATPGTRAGAGPGGTGAGPRSGRHPSGVTLKEVSRAAQREAEEKAIRRALKESGGNKKEAAKQLGVSYKTLWAKLKEYDE